MDSLQEVVDLRLCRGDRRFNPSLGSAFLAQMQLSHPAPLDFSELDYSFATFAQIAHHLYDDLIDLGMTQFATFEKQHLVRACGERAAMSNDDHPDLEVIDDLAQ